MMFEHASLLLGDDDQFDTIDHAIRKRFLVDQKNILLQSIWDDFSRSTRFTYDTASSADKSHCVFSGFGLQNHVCASSFETKLVRQEGGEFYQYVGDLTGTPPNPMYAYKIDDTNEDFASRLRDLKDNDCSGENKIKIVWLTIRHEKDRGHQNALFIERQKLIRYEPNGNTVTFGWDTSVNNIMRNAAQKAGLTYEYHSSQIPAHKLARIELQVRGIEGELAKEKGYCGLVHPDDRVENRKSEFNSVEAGRVRNAWETIKQSLILSEFSSGHGAY